MTHDLHREMVCRAGQCGAGDAETLEVADRNRSSQRQTYRGGLGEKRPRPTKCLLHIGVSDGDLADRR